MDKICAWCGDNAHIPVYARRTIIIDYLGGREKSASTITALVFCSEKHRDNYFLEP